MESKCGYTPVLQTEDGSATLYIGKWDEVCPDCPVNPSEFAPKLVFDYQHPIIPWQGYQEWPRNLGLYSDKVDGYPYNDFLLKAQPLTPELKTLLEYINRKLVPMMDPTLLDQKYDTVLANEYPTGMDYIQVHSDLESRVGPAGVFCIIIGATRTFRIRNKQPMTIKKLINNQVVIEKLDNTGVIYNLPMPDRCVVIMAGAFQRLFTHEIPIEPDVKESRISLTLRYTNE